MKYRVTTRYFSSLCTAHGMGQLVVGDTVDLQPEVAAAFNRDCAGVLVPDALPPPAPEPPTAGERMATGASNRAAGAAVTRAPGRPRKDTGE